MNNTWQKSSDSLPDSDLTVLVYVCVGSEPVWPGYHDGENWYDASGLIFDKGVVTHWMDLPEPPEADHV